MKSPNLIRLNDFWLCVTCPAQSWGPRDWARAAASTQAFGSYGVAHTVVLTDEEDETSLKFQVLEKKPQRSVNLKYLLLFCAGVNCI